jgi:valyl-tRNA synthetase
VYLSREKFEVGRNFTNKIWNASRFVFLNLKDFDRGARSLDLDVKELPLPARWVLSKMGKITAEIDRHLADFALSQASSVLYHFIWNDFCDWYIELAKPTLTAGPGEEKEKTQKVLFYVLEKILRMLHPFMPFVTEEIWGALKAAAADKSAWPETLMLTDWPSGKSIYGDDAAEKSVELLQKAVSGIRDLRVSLNIPPAQTLGAVLCSKDRRVLEMFSGFTAQIKTLARLSALELKTDFKKTSGYVGNAFPEFEVLAGIEGVLDPARERERLFRKISELEAYAKSLERKLANENFVQNAPQDVVDKEKEKLADTLKVLQTHKEHRKIFQ